jgi:oligopeptide/dipeptide ABC transporter ATP-binding protein
VSAPLLELSNVERRFGAVTALHPISLRIGDARAPVMAVAGESGSGKTTLASLLLGFIVPTSGTIRYRGQDVATLRGGARRRFRQEIQAVFQDPFAVYNPFYRVDHALTEPLHLFGIARSRRQARDLMEQACERVGLHPADTLGRFPHQLSGGQRQRLMVARALLLRPKLLIADEPVSMIDASLRSLVLGSLRTLSTDLSIPIIYITHDLATAYHIADTIIVLYRGRVVEAGDAAAVIRDPQHPYTRLLVDSIPWPDLDMPWGKRQPIAWPDSRRPPSSNGCGFAARCPEVMAKCREHAPALFMATARQATRCFLHERAPRLTEDDLSETLNVHLTTNLKAAS